MAFRVYVFIIRLKYSRTQMHPLILLKKMNTGIVCVLYRVDGASFSCLPSGFTGVYLFVWNPKTLTASLSWLLLHRTYFKPCKQAINIFGKQAKLCRMSDLQDSSEAFLIRTLLNMLARLLLSRWGLPMVLPQYACGLHCSAAGYDNAVFIMCNRHTALVWEDAADDGGCVPVGPLNGTELLILLKMATMVFFPLFYAFYFNKKNI